MIRDPSDGSVKTATPVPEPGMAGFDPVIETGTSGLPIDKRKADEAARLQRSRDWLSKYRTDPESVVRRLGENGGEDEQAEDTGAAGTERPGSA